MAAQGTHINSNQHKAPTASRGRAKPSPAQLAWLRHGLTQPSGKLPLFDRGGQRIRERTIRSCLDNYWVDPWFENPLNPGWHVCRLTPLGRAFAEQKDRD